MQINTQSCFGILQNWAASALHLKDAKTKHRHARLEILKYKHATHMVNQSFTRAPLTIGKKTFSRGLAVHAVSEIRVYLPAPGKTFHAVIGRDENSLTRGQKGDIAFSVEAGGKEVYRSPAFHGGEKPVPIAVPLKGATDFLLRVGDNPDWAHGDWAEAYITLEDGRKVWLDELPLKGMDFDNALPPFSFRYGDQEFHDIVKNWTCSTSTRKLDDARTQHTLAYVDPATKLEVRCEAIFYHDFPAVDWVLHFTNRCQSDSPILENIHAMDLQLNRSGSDKEFLLHHSTGSICASRDFQPHEQILSPESTFTLAPLGGRSSSGTMPYFNLESTDGGLITAIGWSGQWQATFKRDEHTQLRIQAGMERTHLKLLPGETIRTPRIVLLFWKGNHLQSQNQWRSFMLKHYSPTPSGKPALPPISYSNWGMQTEQFFIDKAHEIDKMKLNVDHFWIDAGWYGDCKVVDDWYAQAGNWWPNRTLLPNGLKPVADAVHKTKRKFLVWFDCERVYKNTAFFQEHPDWLFYLEPHLQTEPWNGHNENYLLNLGNPEARQTVTKLLSDMVGQMKIDVVRQDFNVDPVRFWRRADAPDRQGISEIRYIEGLYAFWDELLARHPHILIDNCASGGRRLDIEMARRSIPLWRSDLQCSGDYNSDGSQSQAYGLAYWLPLSGAGTREAFDTYDFRSTLGSGIASTWWFPPPSVPSERKKLEKWMNKRIDEAVLVRPYFLGDFYPLTGYSLRNDVWLAFQMHRPDLKGGIMLAFRRSQSPYPTAILKLQGLDPKARYKIRDMDSKTPKTLSGKKLMEEGLPLTLKKAPGSVLVHYQKV